MWVAGVVGKVHCAEVSFMFRRSSISLGRCRCYHCSFVAICWLYYSLYRLVYCYRSSSYLMYCCCLVVAFLSDFLCLHLFLRRIFYTFHTTRSRNVCLAYSFSVSRIRCRSSHACILVTVAFYSPRCGALRSCTSVVVLSPCICIVPRRYP